MKTAETSKVRPPTRIRSVHRAMRALFYVADRPDGATATEIARAADLPVPTVFHLVNTLVDDGMLMKFDRRYHLGPRLGILADAFLREHMIPPYLLGPLRRLSELTDETVYASVWRRGEVAVLGVIDGTHPLRAAGPHTGYQGSTHARASGKCLLASLDADALDTYLATHLLIALTEKTITTEAALRAEIERVKEQGWAIDDEEFNQQISCLAMPVVHDGYTVAALSVAAVTTRLNQANGDYLEALRESVANAGSALEKSGPRA